MSDEAWMALFGLGLVVGIVVLFACCSDDGKVRVIDGCEYIQSESPYNRSLVHKANCTNAIHRN